MMEELYILKPYTVYPEPKGFWYVSIEREKQMPETPMRDPVMSFEIPDYQPRLDLVQALAVSGYPVVQRVKGEGMLGSTRYFVDVWDKETSA
jgi:hypothetical protein